MRNSIMILLCLFLCAQALFAQENADQLQQLEIDVVFLASDYLEGRETGKDGEEKAATYIARRFQEIGLKAAGEDGWFQTFDFPYSDNPHGLNKETRTGRNVVAFLDNEAEQTVVIGAHFDHLGYGGSGSRHTGEPDIHNGADDNASGVAVMLQLAEALAEGRAKQNNYLFIGFSGEELGLIGSKYFTKHSTVDTTALNYMLNLDMVGRLNEEKVMVVNGVGTSPAWKPALESVDVAGISLQTTESGIGPSDHSAFYMIGVPAIHFFTGQHNDYHKPADDAHLVNYQGMLDITDFILELIDELEDDGSLAFTKTKDDNAGKKAAKFKVTLGVMPDYVYQGKGMRIDSVIEGRPAQKAGLKDGDIVIKIGEHEVADIYGYMEALSAYKVGEKAIVVVKRGDQVWESEVTF